MKIQLWLEREYDKIFDKVCSDTDDELYELKIEVALKDGTTYRRSWLDRENRLKEDNEVRR